VHWRSKIRIGETIQFTATVTAIHLATSTVDLKIDAVNEKKEICFDGKGRVMIIEKKEQPKQNSRELKGERIIITGAAGALGRAIIKDFTKLGAELILFGRDKEKLTEIAFDNGQSPYNVYAVDLCDLRAMDEALTKIVDAGAVFSFVHAASPALELLEVGSTDMLDALKQQWAVNVAAFYSISTKIIPTMQPGSSIVAVLTQYVYDCPPPKLAHYVSAKSAAWSLIKSMATELGPRGIRCNAVSPGMMDTLYSKDVPQRMKQVEAATNPMRRLCTVDDVAKVVSFLCGPNSAFVNGVNLPVTGGARMT
jgi:3-oxoacyl-[acyl-carrier protein] reductase